MTVIEVAGLTKRFGKVAAVDHLSFELQAGTATGFLGPNGAGKTTTLRMLLGLVQPTEGTATFGGHSYQDLPDPLHRVGAMLEASSFYPGRTARNHLRVQALASPVEPSRIDEVLEFVGLTDSADRRVSGFSLGMRQRLGLASALLHDPEILILDEPANGLDPEGVRWLRQFLRGLTETGKTVLMSSHILSEVSQTVESVIILDHGRLVTQSSLEKLSAGAQQIIRIRSPRTEDLRVALAAEGATARIVGPDRLEVTGSTTERVGILAAGHSIPIFEITTSAMSLEDMFLHLTTPALQEARS